eukprot:comp6070_c0_seq1/m.1905 comp6070_c0_seq1/g.1905  ORF comp6070_c0_seq1/g.1905 comp6070_c0_seq1/m.1905 type:complete len:141 (-) comp6070_c0_seq1:378-800(-)
MATDNEVSIHLEPIKQQDISNTSAREENKPLEQLEQPHDGRQSHLGDDLNSPSTARKPKRSAMRASSFHDLLLHAQEQKPSIPKSVSWGPVQFHEVQILEEEETKPKAIAVCWEPPAGDESRVSVKMQDFKGHKSFRLGD